MADLVLYKGPAVVPNENLEPIPPILSDPRNKLPLSAQRHRLGQVDRILDEQTTVTRNKVYQRYLVRWKNQPPTEDTWVSREDLMQLDPDLIERHQAMEDPYSTESSYSHPGRIDGGIISRSLWLGTSNCN